MGQLAVARSPETLCARGVGSCVVVAIWDARMALGGMAHGVLPTAAHPEPGPGSAAPARYCDTAVKALFAALREWGARAEDCRAVLVGGASMFRAGAFSTAPALGERNRAAAFAGLAELGLPVVAEDCGGIEGRGVDLDCADGTVTVRTGGAVRRLQKAGDAF